MSIQRHSNPSAIQNSTSDKLHTRHIAAQQEQNTVLQQNTQIDPNLPRQERIVFQVEDEDETTIIVKNTKPNKHNPHSGTVQNTTIDQYHSHDRVAQQDTLLRQNTKANKYHSHYPASQQKTVFLQEPRAIEHHPQLLGQEHVVFQVESDKKTPVCKNTKFDEHYSHPLRSERDTVVRPKDVNLQNTTASEDTKPTQQHSNLSSVRDSAIVKYNSNLPTVHEDEFLPPISRWTKFGGLFIVAVVILAIPISAMTKYKETVKTQASVRPDGELRLVQAATEGRVTQIAVRNNQTVKKGDPIATIDDSRLQTQKSQLENSIQKLRSQLVQMSAQIDALNNQISAENNRIQSSVAAGRSELDRVRREYQDKQVITQAQVRESESNLEVATSAFNAAKAKLNRYQNVAKEGAISQDQLQEVQQALQQQQQAVEAAQAKLSSSQITLNPSNAEVKSATARIAEAKATGAASLATLNKEKQALIQRRIEISQQIDRDNKELRQTKVDLLQTTITATSSGIVSQLNLRNPGQVLRPGEQIARIAPTDSKIVIKTAVPAKSAGKLEVGQTAQMRVSACPYSDYGTLKGTVTAIAPDTIVPQADNVSASTTDTLINQNGNAAYEVVIEPTKTVLGKQGDRCVVQLGMEGQADIITKEKTVLRFLLRKARLTTNL